MARREETGGGHFGVKLPQTTLWPQQLPPTCKIHTHPLLRPSKFSFHYGISLMFRISISNSGPGVMEAPQMQFLRYSYWSLVPLDLN